MAGEESKLWSLTHSAASYIHDTFRITEADAVEAARGLMDLISAKGGDPASFTSDELRELMERQLWDRYEWRDDAKKDAATQRRKAKVDAYNSFLDAQRPSPLKKW